MNAAPRTLKVKSSGSAEPGMTRVAEAFHAATGQPVSVAYSADIEDYDVLICSREAHERKFRPTGRVTDGAVGLGRMVLGCAVRPGVPLPDISTAAALWRAVLAADRIILTDNHTSGLYVEALLRDRGLLDRVTIEHCGNGPLLMERVLAGSGSEIAFLSTNAIRTYADRGLVLVGALPDEVQLIREFVAVPAAGSPAAARDFVAFCGGPGVEILARNGFG